ncbi:MAG: NUDIX hydrolase [Vampirovibrio sp.]|nr:NUDIX hydrolase [Vampirovibrio sp.]
MTTQPIDFTEKMLSTTRIHEGRVVNVRCDEVELINGNKGFREVVEHPGGVVVLPVLPDGRIVFVEQYRYALGHHLLELPAGKLEPGEDPAVAIARELTEETGYAADTWEELSCIYTAPGFCDEKLWLYKASGLKEVNTHQPDDDELLAVRVLTPDEVKDRIKRREIVDAKTICLVQLALNSD